MTISWIEKLFHRLRPENRSLSPDRDVVPRSVLITPPRVRAISATARAQQPGPVAPARNPDPAPGFSEYGFGLVSPLYQPAPRHESCVVRVDFDARGESPVSTRVTGGGDFGGGGAESSWSGDSGSSSDSSSSYSGD